MRHAPQGVPNSQQRCMTALRPLLLNRTYGVAGETLGAMST